MKHEHFTAYRLISNGEAQFQVFSLKVGFDHVAITVAEMPLNITERLFCSSFGAVVKTGSQQSVTQRT